MGSSVSFICKDCKNEHEYLIGVGFTYLNPKELFEDKKDENSKIINGIIKDLEIRNKEYNISASEQVYLCSNCDCIKSNTYVCIESDEEKYVHKYFCPNCNTKMNKIDLEKEIDKSEKIKCQKCKSSNIEREYIEIMWD